MWTLAQQTVPACIPLRFIDSRFGFHNLYRCWCGKDETTREQRSMIWFSIWFSLFFLFFLCLAFLLARWFSVTVQFNWGGSFAHSSIKTLLLMQFELWAVWTEMLGLGLGGGLSTAAGPGRTCSTQNYVAFPTSTKRDDFMSYHTALHVPFFTQCWPYKHLSVRKDLCFIKHFQSAAFWRWTEIHSKCRFYTRSELKNPLHAGGLLALQGYIWTVLCRR